MRNVRQPDPEIQTGRRLWRCSLRGESTGHLPDVRRHPGCRYVSVFWPVLHVREADSVFLLANYQQRATVSFSISNPVGEELAAITGVY